MDITKTPSLQFLLGLMVSVAYVPGIIGASIPTGWLFLIIVAPLLILPSNLPLFLIYIIVSLCWTVNLNLAVFFLLQFIVLWFIFEFGKTISDLRPIFKGLSFGLGISSILAIAQYNGFERVFTLSTNVAGLFLNPNIYSEVCAVILVSLISFRLYYWIPVTLPGLILVHSRASLIVLGLGIVILTKLRMILIPIFIICLTYLYFTNFSFNNISSIKERFDLWADTFRGLSFFGNGIGSFEILYPLNAINIDTSLYRPRYAHNDLLQLVFEFGIGIILLLPIFWKVIKSGNVILYSIGILSLLTFPFHIPMLAFIGCLVAGYITTHNGTIRNIGDSRGSVLFKRNT